LSTAAGTTTTTTDVSAFISNLPGAAKTVTATTTDVTVDRTGDGEAEDAVPDFLDARTRSFGTKDASGSMSQAANVIEALESGALALLVDKDVSAVNFMARDGRMRNDHGRADNAPVVQGEWPVPVDRAREGWESGLTWPIP
jgi:predicted ABC-class ATPase